MILLEQNVNDYDYDIRTLIQAFFDNEKVVLEGEHRLKVKLTVSADGPHHISLNDDKGNEIIAKEFYGSHENKGLRDEVKRQLYDIFSLYHNRKLPWGALTGIRPVHIVNDLVDSGLSYDECIDTFVNDYRVSHKKAKLSVDVADVERRVLGDIDYKDAYSLYIGIPFCPTTCLYCSFASYPIKRFNSLVEPYLNALFKEIDYVASLMKDKKLTSIYIGGGTPTAISDVQIARLIDKVKSSFDVDGTLEFTVEAGRPDSITIDKLKAIYDRGVTRISINPQTMQDKTLKLIGRQHTVEDFVNAYNLAREVGFDDINTDLIMGLPDETIDDVEDTLKRISKLKPDNLTIHSLAIKRAANLNIEMEQYKSHDMGATEEMLDAAYQTAADMNLVPYYLYRQKNIPGNFENVGFARVGTEGLYNILMMEEKQTVLALGAGTVSKRVYKEGGRIERIDNVKALDQYISRIDEMIERKRKLLEGD